MSFFRNDIKGQSDDGKVVKHRYVFLFVVILLFCRIFRLSDSFLFPQNYAKMIKLPLVVPNDAVCFSASSLLQAANTPDDLKFPSGIDVIRYSTFLSQYASQKAQALEAALRFAANLSNSTSTARPRQMIVFDKDGTLGDCTGSLRRWVMHMASKVRQILTVQKDGQHYIIQELYDHLGWDLARDNVVPSAPVAAGTWDDIVSIVFDFLVSQQSNLSVDASLDLVRQWHQELGDLHGQDSPVIDDLRSMMMACQEMGYLVAVCTSDDRAATDAAMKAWHIEDIVDASICGNEVSCGKPSPIPLYELCSKTNAYMGQPDTCWIRPQDCIMVGDTTADTGMSRAASIGFCVGVLTGSGTTEQLLNGGAHLIVPDVSHIPALLQVLRDMASYPDSELRQ